MKFFDTIHSASVNLWRNKGRTILTIIAIFIGAFTISMTLGIRTGVNDYVDKQVNSVSRNDLFAIYKKSDSSSTQSGPQEYHADATNTGESGFFSKKDVNKIKKIKGLKKVEVIQDFSTDFIQSANNKKYVLSASSTDGIDVDLKAGKQVATNGKKYEIALAQDYVKSLGFKSAKEALNQNVKIAATSQATQEQVIIEATIVGVRNPSIVNNGSSVVSKALSDKLTEINQSGLPTAMKDQFYGVTAIIKNPTKENTADLKKVLSKKGYEASTFEDQVGMIHSAVGAVTSVLTLFGAIALLAASFGIINTLYMSVQDRTRDIGLMKAMGMARGKIFLSFSVEALLLGFWGSFLGVLGAISSAHFLNKVASDSFLKELGGFNLVQFNIASVASIILIIMFIAFLAGTLPASRASRLDPIQALRYE